MTTLFYGDNGQHEFWQNKSGSVLIIRNHTEDVWIVMVLNGDQMPIDKTRAAQLRKTADITPTLTDSNLTALIKRIARQYEVRLTFDKSKHWVQNEGPRMTLHAYSAAEKIADAIQVNANDWVRNRITFEEFKSIQNVLWRRAERKRVVDRVTELVRPRLRDLRAGLQLLQLRMAER